MRRVLQGPQAVVDFPVLEELAERGFTDWYGAVSGFEADSILDQPGSLGMACSWSTDRPGGFSAENIALINRLFPIFAVSIKARKPALPIYETSARSSSTAPVGASAARNKGSCSCAAVLLSTDPTACRTTADSERCNVISSSFIS